MGEDGTFGFVHGPKKDQLFNFTLFSVASYDRKKKELQIEGRIGAPIKLELDKKFAEQFLKEVEAAKEKAKREAMEWEQAQMLAYTQRESSPAPELPERGNAGSPVSPAFSGPAAAIASMLQQRAGSPAKSPLAAVMAEISKEPSPVASPLATEEPNGPMVIALYNYEPMEEDELKISEDERLVLLDDSSEDWWLVQRLTGSQRKGLVPSSYLQRDVEAGGSRPRTPYERAFGIQEEAAEEEEDTGLIQPRSPRSPLSPGAGSPSMSAAFMDEIRAKIKSRSPPAIPAQTIEEQIPDEPAQPQEAEYDAPAVMATAPPPPPPLPVQQPQESAVAVQEQDTTHQAPATASRDQEPSPKMPVVQIPSRRESVAAAEKVTEKVPVPQSHLQQSFLDVDKREAAISEDVVKAEPKKVESTVQIPMPKLKPVLKDDKGFNALSSMLLRKQEDIKTGEVRIPSPIKTPVKEEEKPNPWKRIASKNVNPTNVAPPTVKPIPIPVLESAVQRAPQTIKQQPPAESRLWTSRNGQFQVEAKYLGYKDGKVSLLKLNGSRVTVDLDQLGERDKEFVYRREGIPWDQPSGKSYKVGNHDWLAFFMDCGLEPSIARNVAQSCLDKRIGEAFLLSPSFNRDFLLALRLPEVVVLEVLRHANVLRTQQAKTGVERKNLEKIEQLKQLKKELEAVKPPPPAPARRASEVFAELDMNRLTLQAGAVATPVYQQPIQMPVQHAPMQVQQASTMRDIPAMQPTRKDGVKPTVFSNTTILQTPTQYAAPQYASTYAPSGGMLPNLAPKQPYMPPAPQPTQQRMYNVQMAPSPNMAAYVPVANAAPIPLGTTQMRTEYYGYNGGQQQQPMSVQYMSPAPSVAMPPQQQYGQPQQAYVQQPYGQQYQLPQPVNPPQGQKATVGDKYSIFRYVDPSQPQVLPRSNPNAPQTGWQQ